MEKETTLVLGASPNPDRHAYKAVERLRAQDYPVIAVGKRPGRVAGVEIQTEWPAPGTVDTVTLYVGPQSQPPFYDALLRLRPRRVIFNPGTENPELLRLAEASGIATEQACTLVLLALRRSRGAIDPLPGRRQAAASWRGRFLHMGEAPRAHGVDDGKKAFAQRRKRVLDPRRNFRENLAYEDAVGFKFPKLFGQHLSRNAFNVFG